MANVQYAAPVLVTEHGETICLQRVPISGEGSHYNEEFIQKLAFKYPQCLPISEIDRSYEGLIPVCMELNTPAGPLDILYVTPEGRLVIVEAKLWRNPEARRKVIGQILDYAKELSRWSYEDLQREVSRATGLKGNVLFSLVNKIGHDANESDFVDEVSRCLSRGKFLLVILGDGIREGVGAIAEFLESVGKLEFTLGLVELSIYRAPNNSFLVQPRVLAKTAIFNRIVITTKKDEDVNISEQPESEDTDLVELTDSEVFYLKFWSDFTSQLKLDDVSQTIPDYKSRPSKNGFIYFHMPPGNGNQAWVTVYFHQAKGVAGAFLTFAKGTIGDSIYEELVSQQEEIDEDFGSSLEWKSNNGKHKIAVYQYYGNLTDQENRQEIINYLSDLVNRFTNTFRPRLEKIEHNLGL